MVDTSALSTALTGLIGLYPGFALNAPAIGSHHRAPVAYLPDAHKLLRPEILSALGPQISGITPARHSLAATYARYDLVTDTDGTVYENQLPSSTGVALTDAEGWQQTTVLSAWYGRIERGAITKLAFALAGSPPSPALIERQPLYAKEANLQGVLSKSGRFVALKLTIIGTSTAFGVLRVGLQLSGPVTNFPLYLFHSEQSTPVAEFRLTGTTSGRTVWVDANRYLYQRLGGYYLIGYFESDLPLGVSAVGAERGYDVAGCSSCQGVDYTYAQSRQPYVQIKPVYVEPGSLSTGVMNWAEEKDVARQSWGINLIVEARCDATRTLIANTDMLTNALLHMIACDVLEEISTSDRVNGVAAQMRSQAHVALYGQAGMKTGAFLAGQRDKIVADLKTVMVALSPNCLAAETPRRGISFGSMFD